MVGRQMNACLYDMHNCCCYLAFLLDTGHRLLKHCMQPLPDLQHTLVACPIGCCVGGGQQWPLAHVCQAPELNKGTKLHNIPIHKLKSRRSAINIYSSSPIMQFSQLYSYRPLLKVKLTKIKLDKIFKSLDYIIKTQMIFPHCSI